MSEPNDELKITDSDLLPGNAGDFKFVVNSENGLEQKAIYVQIVDDSAYHKLDNLNTGSLEEFFELDSNSNESLTFFQNSTKILSDNEAEIEPTRKGDTNDITGNEISNDNVNFINSLSHGQIPVLRKCERCDLHFPESQMRTHLHNHSKQISSECDEDPISSEERYVTSLPYRCSDCSQSFKTEKLLQLHQKTVHTDEKPFKCDKCRTKFKNKRNLNVHMKVHLGDKMYQCSQCDYSTVHKNCLVTHLWTHSSIKRFKCDICNQFFTSKSKLTDHENNHNNIRPFMCKYCQKRFTRKDNLKVHIRSHLGTKPYKCPICGKLFSSSQGLNYHVKKQNHIPSDNEKTWDEVPMKPNMTSVQSMTPYTVLET